MLSDVIDLRDFYASAPGLVARRLIWRQIRQMWPDLRGDTVVGLGYAVPYLRGFSGEAARLVAAMPASLGVLAWPDVGANAACLVDDTDLPLADRAADRVLVAHTLEQSTHLQALLREIWRVLDDGGRVLVLVPNRSGIWARSDRTPFGHGQPYSMGQINRILRDAMFTPQRAARALFMPPGRRRFLVAMAPALERIGQRWLQPLSGVLLVEASKTIYAGTPVSGRDAKRRYIPVGTARPAAGRTSSLARD